MINIFLFISIMIPIAWSPGANNIMCAVLGTKYSIIKSTPFIIGLNIPIFLYSVVTGVGLDYISSEEYNFLFKIPQLAGVVFLYYLSYKIITSSVEIENKSIPNNFTTGFLLSALNPKILTAILIMYSQFLIPFEGKGDYYLVVLLSFLFVFTCFAGELIWFFIGKTASSLLKSKKALNIQNYTYGFMLILVATWLLYDFFEGL